MDDILALTTIPDLIEQHKDELALGLPHSVDQSDKESMLMLWFNNIGTGKTANFGQSSAVFAMRAYKLLRDYIASPGDKSPYDALVDDERLKSLGLSPEYVGAFLKKQRLQNMDPEDVRNTTYMALFLNTMGVTGKVAMETIMSFYDAAHKDVSLLSVAKMKEKRDTTTSLLQYGEYAEANRSLTSIEINDICSASLHVHLSNKEVSAVMEDNRELVAKSVGDILCVPVFAAETLLAETCFQIVEPMHVRKLFEKAALDGLSPMPAFSSGRRLATMLRSKRLQLHGPRQPTMTDELLDIVLPRRYHLRDGMTIAFLDVFLDVLLGASMSVKQTVHDIVSFACVRGLTDSDEVLDVLERLNREVVKAETGAKNMWDILLREWRRQEIFIIWLEMTRRIVPCLSDLVVGCIGCMQQLAERTVYYFRGTYYVRIGQKTYRSSCFKQVVEVVWKSECLE